MSSDSVSYYDWSLGFKKDKINHNLSDNNIKLKSMNSIGLPNNEFKDYLKKWKEKNLSE